MIPPWCSHALPSCSHAEGTANQMSALYLALLFPLFPLLRLPPRDRFLGCPYRISCDVDLRECDSSRGLRGFVGTKGTRVLTAAGAYGYAFPIGGNNAGTPWEQNSQKPSAPRSLPSLGNLKMHTNLSPPGNGANRLQAGSRRWKCTVRLEV